MNKFKLLPLIFFFLTFSNCTNPTNTKWESRNYDFKVEYSNDWTLTEKSDKKDRLLFGLMDISDGKQYHVEIKTHSNYSNLSD